jgi:hypothetical protein
MEPRSVLHAQVFRKRREGSLGASCSALFGFPLKDSECVLQAAEEVERDPATESVGVAVKLDRCGVEDFTGGAIDALARGREADTFEAGDRLNRLIAAAAQERALELGLHVRKVVVPEGGKCPPAHHRAIR